MADLNFQDFKKRPSVLALGPQDVYPPVDGGKEGIFGALAALARRAEVTYAYPAEAIRPADGYAQIGVSAVPIPYLPLERPGALLWATLRDKPYKFDKYCTDAAARALHGAVPARPFDAIVCHHAHTYRLAQRFARLRGLTIPIIVREHNIEYELVGAFRDALRGIKRLAATFFANLTRREELRIWREADAVAFLSDQDLRTAQSAAGGAAKGFFLAPEGVPIPPRRSAEYPGSRAPLLILLNPRATQSVRNLRDFIHGYWVPLREQGRLKDIELHVTGVADTQLAPLIEVDQAQLTGLGIRGLGFLPELAPTLRGALALVSPTFVGGGIRKKVLEAMAHQLPVIATGIDVACCDYFQRDVNILQMEDAWSFADIVERVRGDEAYWLKLSEHARDTVEEYASWERYGDAITDVINKLTQRRRP